MKASERERESQWVYNHRNEDGREQSKVISGERLNSVCGRVLYGVGVCWRGFRVMGDVLTTDFKTLELELEEARVTGN